MKNSGIEKKALDAISRSGIALMFAEPFYSHVLTGINRTLNSGIPTACIGDSSGSITMQVNPEFFCNQLKNDYERVGVLKHEILHLCLGHLLVNDKKPIELMNIAADLVVNQYLHPWPVPSGAVTLNLFKELSLVPFQSIDYYFKALKQLYDEMKSVGWFMGYAGDFNWKVTKKPAASKNLAELLAKWPELNVHPWEKIKIPPGQLAKVLEAAREITGIDQMGNLPDSILRAINEYVGSKPGIDWKKAIKLLGNKCSKRSPSFSIKRQSKRYGTRPGLRFGFKQRNIAIAIDTSGSIDERTMQLFLREIRGLQATGAKIHIMECDAEIKSEYELGRHTTIHFTGGGGTLFDPVFKRINSSRQIFDGCVYLTDGHGPVPIIRPKCRLLWVLSPMGTDKNLLFGGCVRID